MLNGDMLIVKKYIIHCSAEHSCALSWLVWCHWQCNYRASCGEACLGSETVGNRAQAALWQEQDLYVVALSVIGKMPKTEIIFSIT